MSDVEKRMDNHSQRLDEHSKRLLRIETTQVHFVQEQADLRRMTERQSEVLFGSDNPNETSMRAQINSINVLLMELSRDYKQDRKETVTFRRESSDRLERLEAWKDTVAVPFLTGKKQRQKDWKQFGKEASFWLITFIISTLVAKYFLI